MKVADIKINRNLNDFPYLMDFIKKFEIDLEHTAFVMRPTIYTKLPDKHFPYVLKAHELVHMEQQERDGMDVWFFNYLNDPAKRLEYELEAYRKEKEIMRPSDWRKRLEQIIPHLSGKMYGNLATPEELRKLFA